MRLDFPDPMVPKRTISGTCNVVFKLYFEKKKISNQFFFQNLLKFFFTLSQNEQLH